MSLVSTKDLVKIILNVHVGLKINNVKSFAAVMVFVKTNGKDAHVRKVVKEVDIINLTNVNVSNRIENVTQIFANVNVSKILESLIKLVKILQ